MSRWERRFLEWGAVCGIIAYVTVVLDVAGVVSL